MPVTPVGRVLATLNKIKKTIKEGTGSCDEIEKRDGVGEGGDERHVRRRSGGREFLYRLLVHDKLIQPLPEDQVAQKSMRHKLAIWVAKQLPKDHPLVK